MTDGEAGRRVVAVLEAATESIKRDGVPVPVLVPAPVPVPVPAGVDDGR